MMENEVTKHRKFLPRVVHVWMWTGVGIHRNNISCKRKRGNVKKRSAFCKNMTRMIGSSLSFLKTVKNSVTGYFSPREINVRTFKHLHHEFTRRHQRFFPTCVDRDVIRAICNDYQIHKHGHWDRQAPTQTHLHRDIETHRDTYTHRNTQTHIQSRSHARSQ